MACGKGRIRQGETDGGDVRHHGIPKKRIIFSRITYLRGVLQEHPAGHGAGGGGRVGDCLVEFDLVHVGGGRRRGTAERSGLDMT